MNEVKILQPLELRVLHFKVKRAITNLPYYHGIQWGGFFHSLTNPILVRHGYAANAPDKMTAAGWIVRPIDCAFRGYAEGDECAVLVLVPLIYSKELDESLESMGDTASVGGAGHFSAHTLDFIPQKGKTTLLDEDELRRRSVRIRDLDRISLVARSPSEIKRQENQRERGHRFVDPDYLMNPATTREAWSRITGSIRNVTPDVLEAFERCDLAERLETQLWTYYSAGYGRDESHRKPVGGIWGGASFRGPFRADQAFALAALSMFGAGKRGNHGLGHFFLPELETEPNSPNSLWARAFTADTLRETLAATAEGDMPNHTRGDDGVTIPLLKKADPGFWDRTSEQLIDGTYQFASFTPGVIHGKDGKDRPIAIQPILDRVVSRALGTTWSAFLEGTNGARDSFFPESAWSYRSGRGAESAAIAAARALGSPFVAVKTSIRHFFASVDTRRLLLLCAAILPAGDPTIPWLESVFADTEKNGLTGLPQGHPLSPLLSNMYLSGFDQDFMAGFYDPDDGTPTVRLFRYSDDILAISNNLSLIDETALKDRLAELLGRVALALRPERTFSFRTGEAVPFLGYSIQDGAAQKLPATEIGNAHREDMDWRSFEGGRTLHLSASMTRIAISGDSVLVVSDGVERLVPLRSITRIVVTAHAPFSNEAMYRFIELGIPIFFLDSSGKLKAECLPCEQRRSALRIWQERLTDSPESGVVASPQS